MVMMDKKRQKIKQRNYETIRNVIFMYLIFAFIEKASGKMGLQGRVNFFPQEIRREEKLV